MMSDRYLRFVSYGFIILGVIMLTVGIVLAVGLFLNWNYPNSYLPVLTEANFLYIVSPFLGLSLVFFVIGGISAYVSSKNVLKELHQKTTNLKK